MTTNSPSQGQIVPDGLRNEYLSQPNLYHRDSPFQLQNSLKEHLPFSHLRHLLVLEEEKKLHNLIYQ